MFKNLLFIILASNACVITLPERRYRNKCKSDYILLYEPNKYMVDCRRFCDKTDVGYCKYNIIEDKSECDCNKEICLNGNN